MSTENTMPALPEPYYPQWSHSNEFAAFTAKQLFVYAAEARAPLLAEIERLTAALAQAQQGDARRYRWLRDSYYGPGRGAANRRIGACKSAAELDAAIDAAQKEKP